MRTLEKITIENFKSIRQQTLELGRLNVFIGGNGTGKSNLINVFRFLHEIVKGNLGGYTARKGGADQLLHFGRKKSRYMSLRMEFGEGNRSNAYDVTLVDTPDGRLTIASETAFYHERDRYKQPYKRTFNPGSMESQLRTHGHISTNEVATDLASYRVYHFHDTSDTAALKTYCDLEDNLFLRPQAENLAAFLFLLREKHPDHFRNIEDTVRQIAPFFETFQLMPSRLNEGKILLEWKERGSDAYFNTSSLSDGTLRFICLATLLLQPELPALVLLDEPELGLHPAAINLLAQMLSSASERAQVIAGTQSVTLVNQFTPKEVWTVGRENGQSVFRHLEGQDMSQWLDDYALGEMWEKNIIGGRP